MTYAIPNFTRPWELLSYANTVTSNMFGTVGILLCFSIAFIYLKDYKTSVALSTSAFITTIIATFMKILGLVDDLVLYMCFFGLALAVIWMYFDK